MKITISGTINKIDVIWMGLSTNLTPTQIAADWFDEDIMGYLQAIYIKDNGSVQFQFGRTRGLPENPETDRLTLKSEILRDLCVDLKTGYDTIRCHKPRSFKDNALLGNWSMRRKERDPIEIVLSLLP